MTGIRPTKLAYAMLEEGKQDQEIVEELKRAHYVSREKCELSIEIARREMALLSGIHYQGGYSLYIGIPFCPSTCLYCSFTSYPIEAHRQRVDRYIDCVIREMEYVSQCYGDKVLDTVYIGEERPPHWSRNSWTDCWAVLSRCLISLQCRNSRWRLAGRTVSPGTSWRCCADMGWDGFP